MADNSTLNQYLDEIGRQQLLTDEQERQLSERIRQGDQRAVARLVEANLRYVVKIAALYRGQGLSLDDLVSEGNMGMMAAAAKYDATRGTRFVTYAAPHVRRQIERAIEEQNGLYKVAHDDGRTASQDAPQTDSRVYSEAVENAIESALQLLPPREAQVVSRFFGIGRERETMAEIAEDMGLKRERVRQIRDRAVRRLRKCCPLLREW